MFNSFLGYENLLINRFTRIFMVNKLFSIHIFHMQTLMSITNGNPARCRIM